jgi:hypothetical protein
MNASLSKVACADITRGTITLERYRMRLLALLIVTICATVVARAEDFSHTMTVSSLLRDGFTVVGVIPSQAGPGVFLKKENQLVVCFVSETKTSRSVATQYCKPVE